jgi:uncharacterized DUF497 family protein
MEERRIVWDEDKNAENKLKHKISFKVVQYVFTDPERIWRLDRSESNTSGENRWQTIGRVGKLFFVVYAEHEAEGINETRLITYLYIEKRGVNNNEEMIWVSYNTLIIHKWLDSEFLDKLEQQTHESFEKLNVITYHPVWFLEWLDKKMNAAD